MTKKIVITFIVVLFVSALGLLALELRNNPESVDTKPAQADLIVSAVASTFSDADSDNDGLKDWEETLWNTDSTKADSDNDGTKDGDEVKANRNPAKAAPNDALTKTELEAGIAPNTEDDGANEPKTATDKFARDFFLKYMTLKQTGVTLDADAKESLLQNIMSDDSLSLAPKVYDEKSIVLAQGDTLDAIKTYGNALGQAISKHSLRRPLQNELVIVESALHTDKKSDLEALDPLIAGYSAIIRDTAKLKVPESMVDLHLSYINALSAILSSLQGMRSIFDDQLVGLVSVRAHIDNIAELQASIREITDYFEGAGIVFERGEGGFYFTQSVK